MHLYFRIHSFCMKTKCGKYEYSTLFWLLYATHEPLCHFRLYHMSSYVKKLGKGITSICYLAFSVIHMLQISKFFVLLKNYTIVIVGQFSHIAYWLCMKCVEKSHGIYFVLSYLAHKVLLCRKGYNNYKFYMFLIFRQ